MPNKSGYKLMQCRQFSANLHCLINRYVQANALPDKQVQANALPNKSRYKLMQTIFCISWTRRKMVLY